MPPRGRTPCRSGDPLSALSPLARGFLDRRVPLGSGDVRRGITPGSQPSRREVRKVPGKRPIWTWIWSSPVATSPSGSGLAPQWFVSRRPLPSRSPSGNAMPGVRRDLVQVVPRSAMTSRDPRTAAALPLPHPRGGAGVPPCRLNGGERRARIMPEKNVIRQARQDKRQAKPRQPRPASSSARRSTTSAKASTAPARRSKPSRSACPRLAAPGCIRSRPQREKCARRKDGARSAPTRVDTELRLAGRGRRPRRARAVRTAL